ncbi:MAG: uncharacterized protein A8A55_1511 [Amphiamblys sp. WSBS2006]|nr:MAG: uncharacterized protein A8A55_1511 [Amphiamblys sp. WSBS2006]
MELWKYYIGAFPKLILHEEHVIDNFHLNTGEEEHVSEIIWTENNSIWLGKVKKLEVRRYSVNILLKPVLHKENKLEKLLLDVDQTKHVLGIINTKGSSIELEKVENL